MTLEYVALGMLIFVLVMFSRIIVIHDIPYEIAAKVILPPQIDCRSKVCTAWIGL